MPTDPTAPADVAGLEVTQDARDFANEVYAGLVAQLRSEGHRARLTQACASDDDDLVQAFARYRARIRAEALEEAMNEVDFNTGDVRDEHGKKYSLAERDGMEYAQGIILGRLRALAAPVEGEGR